MVNLLSNRYTAGFVLLFIVTLFCKGYHKIGMKFLIGKKFFNQTGLLS